MMKKACSVAVGLTFVLAVGMLGGCGSNGLARAVLTRGFTITPIGPLPGHERSTAIAINLSGRIAGISFSDVYQGPWWPPFPDTTLGFVWDQGGLTPLRPPAGYHGSWAYGLRNINAKGQVVGTAAQVDPAQTDRPGWEGHPVLVGKKPVRWDSTGNPQLLALPAGYTEGSAWAINNRGQVVGWAGNDLGVDEGGYWGEYWMLWELRVAVFWDRDLQPTLLPPLPEFEGGRAVAANINDVGQVVGNCSTLDYSTGHATLWDQGEVIDLTPGAAGYSEANSINNRGEVVGGSVDHAYLWKDGVLKNLGVLDNDLWSWAVSINRFGQVVGYSSGPPDDPVGLGRGFLWENDRMVDLNSLIDDPNDEWQLSWAYSINDRGQIVGFGYRKDETGEYRNTGFLLTPKK